MGDVNSRHCVRRWMSCAFAFALVTALVAGTLPMVAFADHHEKAEKGEPEMSEEEQAMMQAWQESMQTGPEHEWLAARAGEYDTEIKTWMDPSGEPEVSQGTSTMEMIMGGRILKEDFTGSFMGNEFHGIGYNGYDNVTGRYWGTWVDNMSTGFGSSWGERDGDTMKMKSKFPDPMSGEMKTSRFVITWGDDGNAVMEAFEEHGGEEVRTMQITYTKK